VCAVGCVDHVILRTPFEATLTRLGASTDRESSTLRVGAGTLAWTAVGPSHPPAHAPMPGMPIPIPPPPIPPRFPYLRGFRSGCGPEWPSGAFRGDRRSHRGSASRYRTAQLAGMGSDRRSWLSRIVARVCGCDHENYANGNSQADPKATDDGFGVLPVGDMASTPIGKDAARRRLSGGVVVQNSSNPNPRGRQRFSRGD